MKTSVRRALLIASLCTMLPTAALAHRGWMLPSATVLSGGNDIWVTVDAAISNDLFYFEHFPMRIDNVAVINPDGTQGQVENASRGRYRSTFDFKLPQPGTYKVEMVNNSITASYLLGKDRKRLRGTAESLAKEIPANAEDLRVTQADSRVEFFVTSGKPTTKVLEPTGRGLELAPVTHPNDLVAEEEAKFRFLLDGQPAAGINVTIIPGGIRYRDKLEEIKLVTDADGTISVKWPRPGMYWLNATPERPRGKPAPSAAQNGEAAKSLPQGPAGTLEKPVRRVNYTTTLEVLAQ
ncbi:MAG: DUF4198 domain-containing protein [Burkholderiales bacterium]|nr:DUF4198 domain-containing protein [Burkholderiales bacterium]